MTMARGHRSAGSDNWGKAPKDPFLRKLMANPDRAARISQFFTIGMILFWIFFTAGMFLFVFFLIFT
jgi:hypothetical protein